MIVTKHYSIKTRIGFFKLYYQLITSKLLALRTENKLAKLNSFIITIVPSHPITTN